MLGLVTLLLIIHTVLANPARNRISRGYSPKHDVELRSMNVHGMNEMGFGQQYLVDLSREVAESNAKELEAKEPKGKLVPVVSQEGGSKSEETAKQSDYSIAVKKVSYGHNCQGASDTAQSQHDVSAQRSLMQHCDNKERCEYKIYNINFGDGSEPFPGCHKDFVVDYACLHKTKTAQRSTSAVTHGANGRTIVLDCRGADKIPVQEEKTHATQAVSPPATVIPDIQHPDVQLPLTAPLALSQPPSNLTPELDQSKLQNLLSEIAALKKSMDHIAADRGVTPHQDSVNDSLPAVIEDQDKAYTSLVEGFKGLKQEMESIRKASQTGAVA